MASYFGKTEVDITIKRFGAKGDPQIIGSSSIVEPAPEMELKEEEKRFGMSIKEALLFLIKFISDWNN